MKLFYFLLCTTYVSCFYTDLNSSKEKIVGGSQTSIENINYQASLEYVGTIIGGAVIIAQNWLLSTARIFSKVFNPRKYVKVRTGTSRQLMGGNLYDLKNVIVHEDYHKGRYEADIVLLEALMELNEFQNFIAMVKSSADPIVGTPMQISGFGRESEFDARTSNELKVAEVHVESYSVCDIYAPKNNKVFCATSYPNDTCFGDFGGPAVIGKKLVGLISGGDKYCANLYVPGIYTKVGAFYHWIKKRTGITHFTN